MSRFRIWIILAVLMLCLGIYVLLDQGIAEAWYFFAAAALFVVGSFLLSPVQTAYRHLRGGRLQQAEQYIARVDSPERLLPARRSRYHFVRGMIALQREQYETAIEQLEAALAIGIPQAREATLAQLNLAHTYYVTGKLTESRAWYERITPPATRDLMFEQRMQELDSALTRKGV